MDATSTNLELLANATALETCLMTPRVSGELENWVNDIKAALTSVDVEFDRQVSERHRSLFKQITSQDSDLHSRVELLKKEDESIREQFKIMRDRVQALEKVAPRVQPDEGRLDPTVANFCEEGLAFITRLRKQEVAIDTWHQEAFQRDRGISG